MKAQRIELPRSAESKDSSDDEGKQTPEHMKHYPKLVVIILKFQNGGKEKRH